MYHLQAEGGVFGGTRITNLTFGSKQIGIRIEVGHAANGPWQVVAVHEKPTVNKPSGVSMPVDLSARIRGKTQFYLRLAATNNGSGHPCALCKLGIEGEVIPKP